MSLYLELWRELRRRELRGPFWWPSIESFDDALKAARRNEAINATSLLFIGLPASLLFLFLLFLPKMVPHISPPLVADFRLFDNSFLIILGVLWVYSTVNAFRISSAMTQFGGFDVWFAMQLFWIGTLVVCLLALVVVGIVLLGCLGVVINGQSTQWIVYRIAKELLPVAGVTLAVLLFAVGNFYLFNKFHAQRSSEKPPTGGLTAAMVAWIVAIWIFLGTGGVLIVRYLYKLFGTLSS